MTKEELYSTLKAGKTMDSLFPFSSGQECLIFKADAFAARDEIIYIPDTSLNDVPMDSPLEDDAEIRSCIGLCYTGADFVEQCGGNVELAKELFSYCDWQHPSSALPEVDFVEETACTPKAAACEMTLPGGVRLRASAHDDSDYPGMTITLVHEDGKLEQVCFVEHNPEKQRDHKLCIGVYCAEKDEPVYYDSYHLKES